MTITLSALAQPTADKLQVLLQGERRVLEQLLFRTTELELLLGGGEHRYVARALDEIADAEEELAMYELSRSIIIEALLPGDGQDASSGFLELCSDRPGLVQLIEDLRRLLTAVENSRERCRRLATERAVTAGSASRRLESSGFGPYG